MKISIVKLSAHEVNSFHPIFSTVLKSEFPGYASQVIHYFLHDVYSPAAFRYWIDRGQKIVLVARVSPKDPPLKKEGDPTGGGFYSKPFLNPSPLTSRGEWVLPFVKGDQNGTALNTNLSPNPYSLPRRAEGSQPILGFAVLDQPYGGVSMCRWLGVVKEYQRQGIGRKIIHEWKKFAEQHHCHKIEVAAQPTAKEFYEKMDLELEGMRKQSYFGIDQYVFGKVIGKPDVKAMIEG